MSGALKLTLATLFTIAVIATVMLAVGSATTFYLGERGAGKTEFEYLVSEFPWEGCRPFDETFERRVYDGKVIYSGFFYDLKFKTTHRFQLTIGSNGGGWWTQHRYCLPVPDWALSKELLEARKRFAP